MRPGAGGELAGNSEGQKSSEGVSGRAVRREGGRFCTLPGEIFHVRAGKKSADAVVAKKRGNARGAKGGRNQTKLERGLKGSLRRDLKSKGATAELPESDEHPTTGRLAAIYTRLVGVLPTG